MSALGSLSLVLRATQGMLPAARIDEAACTRSGGSDCTACVSACPRDAITAEAEFGAPRVDSTACISCAACTVACPAQAIGGVGSAPRQVVDAARHGQGSHLTIRCGQLAGRSAAEDDMGVEVGHESPGPGRQGTSERFGVLCLAGLHRETLAAAAAWLGPEGSLELQHGSCSDCPLAAEKQVAELADGLVPYLAKMSGGCHASVRQVTGNDAAGGRTGPDREAVDRMDSSTPQTHSSGHAEAQAGSRDRWGWMPRRKRPSTNTDGRAEPVVTPPQLSRRDLLLGVLKRDDGGSDRPEQATVAAGAATAVRGVFLGAIEQPPLAWPHPVGPCSGCGACLAVCPTDALGWAANHEGRFLHVNAAGCVDCGECVRVCPERALGMATELPHITAGGGTGPAHAVVVPRIVAQVRDARCTRCNMPLGPGESGTCTGCSTRNALACDIWSQLDANN